LRGHINKVILILCHFKRLTVKRDGEVKLCPSGKLKIYRHILVISPDSMKPERLASAQSSAPLQKNTS